MTPSGKVCIMAPFYVKRRTWWGRKSYAPAILEERFDEQREPG